MIENFESNINAKTNLYGLIGSPVEYSYSPYIYNYLFNLYSLNNVYLAFDIKDSQLNRALDGMKAMGLKGINVTSPYKEKVVPYIDDISNGIGRLGVINTIKNIDGKLYGFNTDFYGIVKTFRQYGISLKGKRALILGAGGIAKTALYALQYLGINEICILNRTKEKARNLIKITEKRRIRCQYGELNSVNINKRISNVDIILDATSIDILSNNLVEIEYANIENKSLILFDLKYNPQTLFAEELSERGYKTINGLDTLVWQALRAFNIWTGICCENDMRLHTCVKNMIFD